MTVMHLMYPLSRRPKAGSTLTVYLQDGGKLAGCVATMVHDAHLPNSGRIVIYCGGMAVDEALACGWWPELEGRT